MVASTVVVTRRGWEGGSRVYRSGRDFVSFRESSFPDENSVIDTFRSMPVPTYVRYVCKLGSVPFLRAMTFYEAKKHSCVRSSAIRELRDVHHHLCRFLDSIPPPLPTRGPIELRSLSFLNSRTMFPLFLLLLFSFFRSSSSPTTNARPTRDYSIIPFCSMPLYERKEETRVRDKWRGGKILTVRIVSREDDTSDHSGFDWQNRAYPFPQIKGRRGKGVEINRGSPRRMASNYGGLERGR